MVPKLDTNCKAFQAAIDVLSRPWTALILGILQEGPLRFGEIRERGHGLGDKVLSARLKELEARGLVVRKVEPGPPVRVGYALTPQGCAFNKVAEAIQAWGQELAKEAAE
jgi:DNA-binding HxlR family transcriptional regulator